MAKTVCKVLGLVLLLLGVAGFVAPTLLGLNLNPAHNAIHIVAGVLALYFGFAGSLSGRKGSVWFWLAPRGARPLRFGPGRCCQQPSLACGSAKADVG